MADMQVGGAGRLQPIKANLVVPAGQEDAFGPAEGGGMCADASATGQPRLILASASNAPCVDLNGLEVPEPPMATFQMVGNTANQASVKGGPVGRPSPPPPPPLTRA